MDTEQNHSRYQPIKQQQRVILRVRRNRIFGEPSVSSPCHGSEPLVLCPALLVGGISGNDVCKCCICGHSGSQRFVSGPKRQQDHVLGKRRGCPLPAGGNRLWEELCRPRLAVFKLRLGCRELCVCLS
jgi:hypothetical protein